MKVAKLEMTLVMEVPIDSVNELVNKMSHHAEYVIDINSLEEYGVNAVSVKTPCKLQMPIYDKYFCADCGTNIYPPEDKAFFSISDNHVYCSTCKNDREADGENFLPVPEEDPIDCGIDGTLYIGGK